MAQGVAAPDTVDDPVTRIGDRIKPAARQLARRALTILAGTGAASLSRVGGPIAALAAVFLVATTRPAGPGTQTLQHSLDDGRTFKFTFNPAEATGRLSVTAPDGDSVRFTLQRSPQGGLVFTDALLSGDGNTGRNLPCGALSAIIDSVAPAFAERGSRSVGRVMTTLEVTGTAWSRAAANIAATTILRNWLRMKMVIVTGNRKMVPKMTKSKMVARIWVSPDQGGTLMVRQKTFFSRRNK